MEFIIKTETFARLAQVCSFFDPYIDHDLKQQLNCVRLENYRGNFVAVVSNMKIAIIEHLGITTDSDGYANVILSEGLVKQCQTEAPFGSTLRVTTFPEMAIGTAVTSLNYNHPEQVCDFSQDNPLDDWNKWVPEKPSDKYKGTLYFNLDYLTTLAKCSPSGMVVLPEKFDTEEPVIMRDRYDPQWVGLFMAKPPVNSPDLVPAKLPDWWKK